MTKEIHRKADLQMILSAAHITKSFGTAEILKDVTFHLEAKEKVALVGINGAGKTTIFQILRGAYEPDEGTLFVQKDLRIGYLPQRVEMDSSERVEDELLKVFEPLRRMEERMRDLEQQMKASSSRELMDQYSRLQASYELADGYAYRSHVRGVLKGLGFAEEEYQMPITNLSGGQRSRIALSKLLLQKPDLLLLDEPTNHLDIAAIQWLERYLQDFSGAALIISHDRYFLDKLCTRTIELERGVTSDYSGSYTFYIAEKKKRIEAALRVYEAQQEEIRRQEEIIAKLRSFSQEKFIKRAQSREKILDKMDLVEKPITYDAAMKFHFKPRVLSGNDVLIAHDVSKSFDGRTLFSHAEFIIKRGEKIALLGANGAGKSTLFKMIMGQEKADSGHLVNGVKVTPGYYDQEQQNLTDSKSVLEEIYDAYPNLTVPEVRNILASFLFRGDDVFKQIGDLSGGEKARVSLCKIMLGDSNFLLLDEPTNHLDILSREVLEQNLNSYEGTLLFISHDRYFINQVAHRILVLTADGIRSYIGNYDEYIEQIARQEAAASAASANEKNAVVSQEKTEYTERRRSQSDIRRQRTRLRMMEKDITDLEASIGEIEDKMQLPEFYSNYAAYHDLELQKKEASDRLEALYADWEALSAELEETDASELNI